MVYSAIIYLEWGLLQLHHEVLLYVISLNDIVEDNKNTKLYLATTKLLILVIDIPLPSIDVPSTIQMSYCFHFIMIEILWVGGNLKGNGYADIAVWLPNDS